MTISTTQKMFKFFVSKETFAAMEAESRLWMAQCPCGHGRSVWEMGGIRYKASGQSRVRAKCPQCGQTTWHVLSKEPRP